MEDVGGRQEGSEIIGYHSLAFEDSGISPIEGLIKLAKEDECGIDCDLYQLIYGLSIGLNL